MQIEFEHDRYLRIVAMSKHRAQQLAGRTDDPVYLGQADPNRYRFGARVYGFRGVPGCKCKWCAAPEPVRGMGSAGGGV